MCLLYMSDGFGGDLTTASCLGDALKTVVFSYSYVVPARGRLLVINNLRTTRYIN